MSGAFRWHPQDEVDEAGATRLPVITRGHLEFLKVLYASGPGTPAIRKEVMDAGFGLELADELEELHVISSDQLTPTKIKALATTLIREPGVRRMLNVITYDSLFMK